MVVRSRVSKINGSIAALHPPYLPPDETHCWITKIIGLFFGYSFLLGNKYYVNKTMEANPGPCLP